jgi:hypothetical protein
MFLNSVEHIPQRSDASEAIGRIVVIIIERSA